MSPVAARPEDGTCLVSPGSGEAVPTVADLLSWAADLLRHAGIENPRREARILVAHASGFDETAVVGYPESRLGHPVALSLRRFVGRRADGEPLSRILNRREFWSLDFRLSMHTLDPRPDSETLVEAVLKRVADPGRALRILDLGTGSGCLLLALLSELPKAFGVGVDISYGACLTAAANARALGLSERVGFVASDWASANSGGFDVVVSNPPYVPRREIAALDREVREHDPYAALCGGEDGLTAYRRIAAELPRLLSPGGFVALEIGAGQRRQVAEILAGADLRVRSVHRDLAGFERCLVAEAENPRLAGERGF